MPSDAGSATRPRALAVVVAFAAALALGVALLLAFALDIQTIGARELFDRRDEARSFFLWDYVFVFLYAVVSPIAQWRFIRATGTAGARWMPWAPMLLVAAGLVDATENALLLAGTRSVSSGAVDVAHALAIPKLVLFFGATLLSIAVLVRALRVLREQRGV